MTQPEARFSRKVIKLLEKIPETYVIRTQAGSIVGIPDLLICHKGRFYAWELKVGDNTATAIQLHELAKIRMAGGSALVVRPGTLDLAIKIMLEGKLS